MGKGSNLAEAVNSKYQWSQKRPAERFDSVRDCEVGAWVGCGHKRTINQWEDGGEVLEFVTDIKGL